jgi:hypothetical protein
MKKPLLKCITAMMRSLRLAEAELEDVCGGAATASPEWRLRLIMSEEQRCVRLAMDEAWKAVLWRPEERGPLVAWLEVSFGR